MHFHDERCSAKRPRDAPYVEVPYIPFVEKHWFLIAHTWTMRTPRGARTECTSRTRAATNGRRIPIATRNVGTSSSSLSSHSIALQSAACIYSALADCHELRVPRKPRKYPLGQSRGRQTMGKHTRCVAFVKSRGTTTSASAESSVLQEGVRTREYTYIYTRDFLISPSSYLAITITTSYVKYIRN